MAAQQCNPNGKALRRLILLVGVLAAILVGWRP